MLCLLIWSTILCSLPGKAQSVKLAYYDETLVHYGLKAGLDYPLAEKTKHKTNGHIVRKALMFSPALTLYHHFQNHTGLIVSPEVSYRRRGKAGGIFELALSPSYLRYFLSGTTYQVTPEGVFKKVPLAGRSTFLPTFSVGLGKIYR